MVRLMVLLNKFLFGLRVEGGLEFDSVVYVGSVFSFEIGVSGAFIFEVGV